MRVNEIQALRNSCRRVWTGGIIKTVLDCLRRREGLIPFLSGRRQASFCQVSPTRAFEGSSQQASALASHPARYNDIVGIVNAYDMFRGATKDAADAADGRNTLGLCQTQGTKEDCKLPLLAHGASYALKEAKEHGKKSMRTAGCVMSMNTYGRNAPTTFTRIKLREAIRAGEREAIEHLLERPSRVDLQHAIRMLYHPQDAEDATQEIIVQSADPALWFEGRSRLPHLGLYRVVFNHC